MWTWESAQVALLLLLWCKIPALLVVQCSLAERECMQLWYNWLCSAKLRLKPLLWSVWLLTTLMHWTVWTCAHVVPTILDIMQLCTLGEMCVDQKRKLCQPLGIIYNIVPIQLAISNWWIGMCTSKGIVYGYHCSALELVHSVKSIHLKKRFLPTTEQY